MGVVSTAWRRQVLLWTSVVKDLRDPDGTDAQEYE
ncbi:hypothetical protein KIPB_011031, partial [Kipferlia bialata]|eukprot:g11031.t1